MIILPDREEIKQKYIDYSNNKLQAIRDEYGTVVDAIGIKKQHGLTMAECVEQASKDSGMLNETYAHSAYIEGLLHDVGRFTQYLMCGSLNDNLLYQQEGYFDHGNLGKVILEKDRQVLLRYFLEIKTKYDQMLLEVIGEHTNIRNGNYVYSINELKGLFNNISFDEVLESDREELKNKLIALKLMILQEIDGLELLQNIINGAFTPKLRMNPESYANGGDIWQDFLNFRYIDMGKYKGDGSWTLNSGFLLRYGLLTHKVNFVGTLKNFRDSDSFRKLWEITQGRLVNDDGEIIPITDPLLKDAQEYIQLAVDNLIATSQDGVIITPESREEARKLTLKMWGQK